MKRKLDQNDVPSAEPEAAVATDSAPAEPSFTELGLDARLVQAVAEQSYLKPTLVQRKAIPLALNGQDVLCKAKTGSGKTAAYVLPVLSGILKRKSVSTPITRRCLADKTGRPRHLYRGPDPRPDPRTRRPGLQSH